MSNVFLKIPLLLTLFVSSISFADSAKEFVCYRMNGQMLIMNDGSMRSQGTGAFSVKVSNSSVEISSIKGSNYDEVLKRDDVELFWIQKTTVNERHDLILNVKSRNFVLACELD
mgnify:CR=1 FL=1